MAGRSYAYNTRKKTPEQLEKELVGSERWDILNGILEELSLKKGEHPKQHWMIVGPRGIGKSHLLTLLYHKINSKTELAQKWITVLFPEELRMANNLAKFLERTVNEILLEFEKEQSPFTKELQMEIKKIKEIRASERIEHLFSILNWINQSSGKFILLLIENLQQLIGKKISIIEQKKLRAFLQTNDNVLIVGSATTVFNALHDHKHPFYHFFHIRRLNDLNFDEIKTLIKNILIDDDRQDITKKVAKNEARMRALYSFTGGNPRMAVFLSDILKTEVPDELLDFMDEILEDLTPYFEAILNDTPYYMEEIMNTLALHEPAQSPKEIAGHLEMAQTTTRNYLKQMKDNGYVRVAFSKGRSNYYCLNEYLYRIWYQMRDSSHREETRWLMELLMMLFSPKAILEEKRKFDKCNIEAISDDSYKRLIFTTADFIERYPDYCKIIEWCVDSTKYDKKETTKSKAEKELFNKARKYRKNKQHNKAIEEYKKMLEIDPESAVAYWHWGDSLRDLKQYESAIEKFRKSSEIAPDAASAYGAWGDCLKYLGKYNEAVEKYAKAVEKDPEYEFAHNAWGYSLIYLARYNEAIKKFKRTLKINPNFESAYLGWGICLRKQQRYDEAIEKCKKALEINPKSKEAIAGWVHCLMKGKCYKETVELIENNKHTLSRCSIIFSYGKSLFKVGRYTEASTQFKRLIELQYNCGKVFMLYGMTLEKLDDRENSLLAYLTQTGLNSVMPYIDLKFHDIYKQYMLPILQTLKPEAYIKQFYALETSKFSRPILGIFLIMLDKYDVVSELFKSIASEEIEKEEKEKFDFEVMVFSIKQNIWLKLIDEKVYEALRLVELYAEYIKLLKTDKKKADEVSKLILSLFKLQVHMNVNNENIHQILERLKYVGVPFSDLFFKVWKCLSEPDSIDAQRYLSDKAIAELIEQIKSKDEPNDSDCI